jgi:D-xylose transport system substrate-binding protein
MHNKTQALLAAIWTLLILVSGCGSDGSAGAPALNRPKVGVILPDRVSSARWETLDHPLLASALAATGVDADIRNADGDEQRFSRYADDMIKEGVKVLMIASLSTKNGAEVEEKARAAGVLTVDYDRLNLGGSASYYVSFDNVAVGQQQAQGLAGCLGPKRGAKIVEIEGAPTDNNATLVHDGHEQVLKPKYDSGEYTLVQSQFIDEWDAHRGAQAFEQILTANKEKVDGVAVANDGLADAVIGVLRQYGLAGKVPVTGQDATLGGLRSVLRGEQCMTVYKPVRDEAATAAGLVSALAKGDKGSADTLATGVVRDNQARRDVPSLLIKSTVITKDNIKRVITDNAVSATDLCSGDTAALCRAADLSS